MITADELDGAARPRVAPHVVAVEIGAATVLLDGWRTATVLNGSGRLIWDSFDGETCIEELAERLGRRLAVDPNVIRADALALARAVGSLGLLDGVGPPAAAGEVTLTPIPLPREVGDVVDDFRARGPAGHVRTFADLDYSESLLVHWNPHCGYCASIAESLGALRPRLEEQGVGLVLLATGPEGLNRDVARTAGLEPSLHLLDPEARSPFFGYGTPVAFHVDAGRRLLSPLAVGNADVPELAACLAGVDLAELAPADPEAAGPGVRYLLEPGGVCATGTGTEPTRLWASTPVFRVGGYHVGIRCDSDSTAQTLDRLFRQTRVDDHRAGHSYSVALAPATGSGPATDLNLLVQGGQVLVRSRSISRVLRALLWQLDARIVPPGPLGGRIRVRATAARVGKGMVLLPPGLYVLEERLQPLLARRGVALADVPFPVIDLDSAEIVIPEPAVPHDPAVVAELDGPLASRSELAPVLPGRYPLLGWGVLHPAEAPVTRFSPAEAAAATLSFTEDADDPGGRLRLLGDLFGRVEGFGLWYHSEAEYADAVAEALGVP